MSGAAPSVVLFDVEGTTTSISFVHEVLFPYARKHLPEFIERNRQVIAPILAEVPGDAIATLTRWIDEDVKATPLKTLQGLIWREGYRDGTLRGHVYPDAAACFGRLHARGTRLAIYSSGSIEAQRLLFAHSTEGDLAGLFAAHFDTTSGPKREAESYADIAGALTVTAERVLFVSDTPAEIAAARETGMATRHIDRDGGPADLTSLDQLLP